MVHLVLQRCFLKVVCDLHLQSCRSSGKLDFSGLTSILIRIIESA